MTDINANKIVLEYEKRKEEFLNQSSLDAKYFDCTQATPNRAVVVYRDTQQKERWGRRLKKLESLEEIIKEKLPKHFPENSEIYLRPKHLKDVVEVRIYNSDSGINSRLIKKTAVIGTLKNKLEALLEADRTSPVKPKTMIEIAKKQIQFFEESETPLYRLRSKPHPDITVMVTLSDGQKVTERVTRDGLFITPARGCYETITVRLPQFTVQKHQKGRPTVYSQLKRIPCCAYEGSLYDENERLALINAKKT